MQTIVYECLMTYCASGLAGVPEDRRPGKDDTGWPQRDAEPFESARQGQVLAGAACSVPKAPG